MDDNNENDLKKVDSASGIHLVGKPDSTIPDSTKRKIETEVRRDPERYFSDRRDLETHLVVMDGFRLAPVVDVVDGGALVYLLEDDGWSLAHRFDVRPASGVN